jgi:hypothetical protein
VLAVLALSKVAAYSHAAKASVARALQGKVLCGSSYELSQIDPKLEL